MLDPRRLPRVESQRRQSSGGGAPAFRPARPRRQTRVRDGQRDERATAARTSSCPQSRPDSRPARDARRAPTPGSLPHLSQARGQNGSPCLLPPVSEFTREERRALLLPPRGDELRASSDDAWQNSPPLRLSKIISETQPRAIRLRGDASLPKCTSVHLHQDSRRKTR